MPDIENGSDVRGDLLRHIADTYGISGEGPENMLIFRAGNGRIFASIEGNRLDAVCGRAASSEFIRPYLRPCDMRPDSWVSVDMDGLVRFNIICSIIEVAIKFVTSREPMDARELTAQSAYRSISARIHVSLPQRTYTDVPLEPDSGDNGKECKIPEEIRKMRSLLTPEEMRTHSEPYIFVLQARFLENFEDDYEYNGKRGALCQTYNMMSDQQLRGYFGWRTAIRAGREHKGSAEYPYIYACELINGIGWKDPADGLHKLTAFLESVPPETFPHRDYWLYDFCAFYNVQGALPPLTPADTASHTLERPYESTSEDALATAIYMSNDYKIGMSKIMRENESDVAEVLLRVFRMLHDKMEGRDHNLLDKGFSPVLMTNHRMFATARLYDPGRGDYEYIIPGVVRYNCSGTLWSRTIYRISMAASRWFSAIVRTVDSLLRPYLDVKGALKPALAPGTMEYLVIRAAIEEWDADRKRAPVVEVNVDTSILDNIRRDADDVRDRILTEEERGPAEVYASAAAAEPSFMTLGSKVSSSHLHFDACYRMAPLDDLKIDCSKSPEVHHSDLLNDVETAFVRCLLNGESYKELLKKNRMSVDIAADSVNEALLDEIGDTVIDMSSGEPEIIEDYRKELESIVNG